MTLPRSVADVLAEHVTLEVESIDRMYLSVYVPGLQYQRGVVGFFRDHRGHAFASSALMGPMTKAFVAAIHQSVKAEGVPLVGFRKGQRKDDVAREHLARFAGEEGVPLWAGPRRRPRCSHGEAPQPGDRGQLRLDRALHRDGQPLLRLRRGR